MRRRALRIAQDQAVEREPLAMAQPLVREKEEGPVLDEWAAEMAAEQVALKGRRPTGVKFEEVASVERVIAQELEHLAVEFIGARARRDVDDGAGILPVFGAESRGIHLEFLNAAD